MFQKILADLSVTFVAETSEMTGPCDVVKLYPAPPLSAVAILVRISVDFTLYRYVVFGVRPVRVTEWLVTTAETPVLEAKEVSGDTEYSTTEFDISSVVQMIFAQVAWVEVATTPVMVGLVKSVPP